MDIAQAQNILSLIQEITNTLKEHGFWPNEELISNKVPEQNKTLLDKIDSQQDVIESLKYSLIQEEKKGDQYYQTITNLKKRISNAITDNQYPLLVSLIMTLAPSTATDKLIAKTLYDYFYGEARNKKIIWIKNYKQLTNTHLKDAKDIVETITGPYVPEPTKIDLEKDEEWPQ